ncbi:MAG: Uma2 family endonuclease [Armatimonadetes bacterium]|nr:Uma2 family endonuclease [Armatimonadota bacterium]
MGTTATLLRAVPPGLAPQPVPPLENGERLTLPEFERRYEVAPEDLKAELIEGVVYMSSPVRGKVHGRQTFRLSWWLAHYSLFTPGTEGYDNTTVRLDVDNEPQPDAFLLILPEFGGQSSMSDDGYNEDAPELVAEVAASSRSIDLHAKFNAYRRNRVREYLVWRVLDGELDWFVWREGEYQRLIPDDTGIYRSEVFPGLWLNAPALLRDDRPAVLQTLQAGLESPEHADFVAALQARD